MMVGVILVFSTLRASADTITVNGTVLSSGLPGGATILSPGNGAHLTAVPVLVTGTCDIGAGYYVTLFRNDIFSGSTPCSGSGTFSISSDLFDGQNILTAHELNAADQEGPVSAPVTVYYDRPSTGQGAGGTGSSGSGKPLERFYISPDHDYRAGFTGQDVTEKLTFIGGQKPYALTINWGDGYATTLDHITDGTVTVKHRYGTAANVRTYYTVTVQGSDSRGAHAGLQLFTIMNDPTITGLSKRGPFTTSGPYYNALLHALLFAWPAYLIAVLMALCFWLGERRGEAIGAALIRRSRQRLT